MKLGEKVKHMSSNNLFKFGNDPANALAAVAEVADVSKHKGCVGRFAPNPRPSGPVKVSVLLGFKEATEDLDIWSLWPVRWF